MNASLSDFCLFEIGHFRGRIPSTVGCIKLRKSRNDPNSRILFVRLATPTCRAVARSAKAGGRRRAPRRAEAKAEFPAVALFFSSSNTLIPPPESPHKHPWQIGKLLPNDNHRRRKLSCVRCSLTPFATRKAPTAGRCTRREINAGQPAADRVDRHEPSKQKRPRPVAGVFAYLEHDPEKHALDAIGGGYRFSETGLSPDSIRGSCSKQRIERDGDSKKRYHALKTRQNLQLTPPRTRSNGSARRAPQLQTLQRLQGDRIIFNRL